MYTKSAIIDLSALLMRYSVLLALLFSNDCKAIGHYPFYEGNLSYFKGCVLENDDFIIAYTDIGNQDRGVLISGSITGEGVVYGDTVVFNNDSTRITDIFSVNSDQAVVVYNTWENSYPNNVGHSIALITVMDTIITITDVYSYTEPGTVVNTVYASSSKPNSLVICYNSGTSADHKLNAQIFNFESNAIASDGPHDIRAMTSNIYYLSPLGFASLEPDKYILSYNSTGHAGDILQVLTYSGNSLALSDTTVVEGSCVTLESPNSNGFGYATRVFRDGSAELDLKFYETSEGTMSPVYHQQAITTFAGLPSLISYSNSDALLLYTSTDDYKSHIMNISNYSTSGSIVTDLVLEDLLDVYMVPLASISKVDSNRMLIIYSAYTDDFVPITAVNYFTLENATAIDHNPPALPDKLTISSYPNPFNPSTTISYSIPENADVSIVIYDVNGREVQTLFQSSQYAGRQEIQWDGTSSNNSRVSTGVYFARIKAGSFTDVIKMVYLQ